MAQLRSVVLHVLICAVAIIVNMPHCKTEKANCGPEEIEEFRSCYCDNEIQHDLSLRNVTDILQEHKNMSSNLLTILSKNQRILHCYNVEINIKRCLYQIVKTIYSTSRILLEFEKKNNTKLNTSVKLSACNIDDNITAENILRYLTQPAMRNFLEDCISVFETPYWNTKELQLFKERYCYDVDEIVSLLNIVQSENLIRNSISLNTERMFLRLYEIISMEQYILSRRNLDNETLNCLHSIITATYTFYNKLVQVYEKKYPYLLLIRMLSIKLPYVNTKNTSKYLRQPEALHKLKELIYNFDIFREGKLDTESLFFFRELVFPILCTIEFLLGIAGNSLLIMILVRHKIMRSKNNLMIFNLTLADTLSLFVNLPLSYIFFYQLNPTDASCKTIFFLRCLSTVVSTYCIVFLGYDRYCIITSMVKMSSKKLKEIVKTIFLWTIGITYSGIACVFITVRHNFCYVSNSEEIRRYEIYFLVFNCVVICIMPIILVAVFYISASIHLRKKTENFPGDRTKYETRIKDRILASKALLILAIVFLVSYLPYNITLIIHEIKEIQDSGKTLNFEIGIVYSVMFSHLLLLFNSMFNPLLLYFLSSKFRKYIRGYIQCKGYELENRT